MRRLLILLKLQIQIVFSSLGKISRKKKINIGVLLVLAGAFFAFIMSQNYLSIITQMRSFGNVKDAIYFISFEFLVLILIFSTAQLGVRRKGNDDEFLLSLPFKKYEIVISKFLKEYVFSLAQLCVIVLPAYVVYYLNVNVSYTIIIWGVFITLVLALAVTSISAIISKLTEIFSARFKSGHVVQTIILVIVTSFTFALYFVTVFQIGNINQDIIDYLKNIFIVNYLYEIVLNNNIVYFLILLMMSLAFAGIAITIFAVTLGNIKVRTFKSRTKLTFKKLNPARILMKKELTRITTNSMYLLNSSISLVFMIVLSVAIHFFNFDELMKYIGVNAPNNLITIAILLCPILLSSSCIASSSSVSLEGKQFWILKANPIKLKHIFIAKIGASVIISILPVVIYAISASTIIGFEYLIPLIILPLLGTLVISTIGLYVNILNPKLDWTNEMMVIKSGMSVLYTMIVSFGLMIVYAILAVALASFGILFVILGLLILLIMLASLFIFIISKHGKKAFEKLY